jgi:hypothetical protein
MKNKELEFLGKIKQVITLLDEIDEIINAIPSTQQKNDYLLSDYLHIIENDEFGTVLATNITDKIKQARNERRAWNNINLIANTFTKNKYKLIQPEQRKELTKILSASVENVHQEYKYRILSEQDIKELYKEHKLITDTNTDTNNEKKDKKKRKKYKKVSVTKEWLEAQLETKTCKEIAKELEVSEGTVTNLKRKLNINIRVRNKKKNS